MSVYIFPIRSRVRTEVRVELSRKKKQEMADLEIRV